ncbi:hypothetical protein [Bacillus sp. CHD6a]|uniref:hypothetical protein n=1 Tax=Bacillus sp. CHD6a TaxID=1643452 RepID=UPI0006CC3DA2|nr:hypothetical protein [Bacillus sp. CHD6a]KPB04196.1 hypothetical protein AAV98_13130 [Bacillus sp. CHD6a]
MWSILIALASTFLIIMIDGKILWQKRKQNKKEFWVFVILLSIGFTLWIAYGLNYQIPTPLDLIKIILEPLSKKILDF